METNRIIHGDCLETIKTFPDKSINCVITSPPYWQLRDYGWSGQWGLEPTFTEYLNHLWQLMDEIHRVLTDDGTVWVNLGDTYGGGSGVHESMTAIKNGCLIGNLPPKGGLSKCLLLIPHRFAIGCIERGWIVRNDIIWAKRNGMPESVTDRMSKKHEYIFLMAKSEKYYFDLDGIRDKQKQVSLDKMRDKSKENYGSAFLSPIGKGARPETHVNGKNPGSVSDFWDITTKPSGNKHYATFNTDLISRPIIAGCPVDGIILDPFCGTATTGCRAIDLGRRFIGIEGNAEYVKIGNNNLRPYLQQQQLFRA